jgi:hypothetical protein
MKSSPWEANSSATQISHLTPNLNYQADFYLDGTFSNTCSDIDYFDWYFVFFRRPSIQMAR